MAPAPTSQNPAAPGVGTRPRRDRVAIDLRDCGSSLAAHAQARRMPVSALVRTILRDWLATQPGGAMDRVAPGKPAPPVAQRGDSTEPSKVTLRMTSAATLQLAQRARAAEMSQGAYVEHLLDGIQPAPVDPGYEMACVDLNRSTATLAALSGDVYAFSRAIDGSGLIGMNACSALAERVASALEQHLALAAPVLASLSSSRRMTPRKRR